MYQEFYNLIGAPFLLTPDRKFFFRSQGHDRALSYLIYGLAQQEGFIVITGDVGAGKTTLANELLNSLDNQNYIPLNIVTTHLTGSDLIRLLAEEMRLDNPDASKGVVLSCIREYLKDSAKRHMRCVLVIDEAQNLSDETLEELRMLSNFSFDGFSPLQTFLLGQPEFREILGRRNMEQLRQRVISSYHLGPMSLEETKEYIIHRMLFVGWDGDPEFSEDAFAEIYDRTSGVPRRINILCSRLLFLGVLEDLHYFTGVHVAQVAEDLKEELALVTVSAEAPVTSGAPLDAGPDVEALAPEDKQDVMARLQALEDRCSYLEAFIRDELMTVTSNLDVLCGNLKKRSLSSLLSNVEERTSLLMEDTADNETIPQRKHSGSA